MTAEWITSVQRSVLESQRRRSLVAAWQWLTVSSKKMLTVRENRRLRVAETVSLGDRRFVVLLEADNQHYLVGASSAGVTLLTRLDALQTQPTASTLADSEISDEARVPASADSVMPCDVTQDVPQVVSAHAPVEVVNSSCSVPASTGVLLPPAPQQQAGKPYAKVPDVAGAMFPLASSGLRRHAFPIGRALGLLLAFQLLLPVCPLLGQAQTTGPAAASKTTTAAPSAAAANTSVARTPAAKTVAQPNNNASGLSLTGLGGSSAPWTIVVLLTVLTLIPSLMICMTPFARLLVVFHFLRQALGLQTTPSNQTLIGLSLILTFFIMEPLGKQIYSSSFIPLQNGQITALEALDRGSEPLRHFMAHYVREKDAALFLEIAHAPRPKTIDDVSLRVLMPAYIVSELKAGFQIGAVLFLPFLVVDIVIASITTSVGMMQLPPVVISTPLKLMLFLMVDGWHLLIGALVRSFY